MLKTKKDHQFLKKKCLSFKTGIYKKPSNSQKQNPDNCFLKFNMKLWVNDGCEWDDSVRLDVWTAVRTQL